MNAIQQCENEFANNIAVLFGHGGRNGYQVNFDRTVSFRKKLTSDVKYHKIDATVVHDDTLLYFQKLIDQLII